MLQIDTELLFLNVSLVNDHIPSHSVSQSSNSRFSSSFFIFQHHSPVTPVTSLCAEAREAAQKLLNHYVKVGLLLFHLHCERGQREKYTITITITISHK